MKTIHRLIHGFAIMVVLAGLMSTFHPSASRPGQLLASQAAAAEMPVPVCPPNDPNACGIDKW